MAIVDYVHIHPSTPSTTTPSSVRATALPTAPHGAGPVNVVWASLTELAHVGFN